MQASTQGAAVLVRHDIEELRTLCGDASAELRKRDETVHRESEAVRALCGEVRADSQDACARLRRDLDEVRKLCGDLRCSAGSGLALQQSMEELRAECTNILMDDRSKWSAICRELEEQVAKVQLESQKQLQSVQGQTTVLSTRFEAEGKQLSALAEGVARLKEDSRRSLEEVRLGLATERQERREKHQALTDVMEGSIRRLLGKLDRRWVDMCAAKEADTSMSVTSSTTVGMDSITAVPRDFGLLPNAVPNDQSPTGTASTATKDQLSPRTKLIGALPEARHPKPGWPHVTRSPALSGASSPPQSNHDVQVTNSPSASKRSLQAGRSAAEVLQAVHEPPPVIVQAVHDTLLKPPPPFVVPPGHSPLGDTARATSQESMEPGRRSPANSRSSRQSGSLTFGCPGPKEASQSETALKLKTLIPVDDVNQLIGEIQNLRERNIALREENVDMRESALRKKEVVPEGHASSATASQPSTTVQHPQIAWNGGRMAGSVVASANTRGSSPSSAVSSHPPSHPPQQAVLPSRANTPQSSVGSSRSPHLGHGNMPLGGPGRSGGGARPLRHSEGAPVSWHQVASGRPDPASTGSSARAPSWNNRMH